MKKRVCLFTASILAVSLVACSEIDPSKDNRVDGGIVEPNGEPNLVDPDAGGDGVPFRVATFNTRRLFDTVCHSGNCEEGDFELQPSDAEFAFKLDQVSDGIRALEADAVMLQEVENETALVGIYERLDDIYNIAIMGETGNAGSLDTAILARGEYVGTLGHQDTQLTRPDGSTTGFAREFLEVRIIFEGTRVNLFSAHFKSQRNDDPGRRIAEAEGARDIAIATSMASPGSLVVVGGDLNDTPDSQTMDVMTAGGFLDLVEGPDDDWWTYGFGDRRSALDHILNVPNEDIGVEVPISIYRDSSGGYASSDHSAVTADYTLPFN